MTRRVFNSLNLPLLVVAATLLSSLPASGATLPTRPLDDFTSAILAPYFEADLGEQASLAVLAFDPATGRRFVEYGTEQPLRPASLQKLLTAALALEVLGPSHRFITTVQTYAEQDEAGALKGDLILLGGGDPSLGPRFQPDRGDVTKIFRDWAADLKAQGIRSIEGDIIGDGRLFEDDPHGIGWDPVDYGEWFAAEVSALTFNDGCVDIHWRATASEGKPARYKLSPETSYLTFEGAVKVGQVPGGGAAITCYRADDQGKTIARGMISPGATSVSSTAVRNPARFTAHVFRQVLIEEGIAVTGGATTPWPGQEIAPPGATPRVLVRHFSPTLAEMMPVLLAHSQNLYAETLLRAAALEMGHPASFEGAGRALTEWARQKGIARSGFLAVDGSGLSIYNRVSARAVGELLAEMNGWGRSRMIWRHAMARAGEPGSLSARLGPLKGRFAGKTGTLTGTSTLAGYLQSQKGTTYVVVLMIDSASGPTRMHRKVLDEILLRLDTRLP